MTKTANASCETRATLLLRLRPDSPERECAWQEFYEVYSPLLTRFARRVGAPTDEIPDIVQEVMLGFFRVSPEFLYDPNKGSFRGYLRTCTWRVLQRRLRGRCLLADRDVQYIADTEPSVEQLWQDVWDEEDLRAAMEQVRLEYSRRPDRLRTYQAFELFAILGQSATSIADELGMSVDGVYQAKSRVSRAIKQAIDTRRKQYED